MNSFEWALRSRCDKTYEAFLENCEKGVKHFYKTTKIKPGRNLRLWQIKLVKTCIAFLLALFRANIVTDPQRQQTLKTVEKELNELGEIAQFLCWEHQTQNLVEQTIRRETSMAWLNNKMKNMKDTGNMLEETYVLHELARQLVNYTENMLREPNRKAHYKALETESSCKGNEPRGAVLLALQESGSCEEVGKILGLERKETNLSILPETYVTEKEERTGKTMERVSFQNLQKTDETLRTGLQLYSENPELTFERCVELAEKL